VGNLAYHWRAVTYKGRGGSFQDFLQQVKELPSGQLWRHNQAGDLPGDGVGISHGDMRALVAANKKKKGFTYTHYDMGIRRNREIVRLANLKGFTVNASFERTDDAVRCLKKHKIPAVTILPVDAGKVTVVDGVRVVKCPAYWQDKVTCARCQLCQRQGRDYVIGFPAHGVSWRKVDKLTRGEV
jgi:hypothetical protein